MLLVGKLYRAGRRMVGTAGGRREELAKGRKISVSIVRGMKNCQVKLSWVGRTGQRNPRADLVAARGDGRLDLVVA